MELDPRVAMGAVAALGAAWIAYRMRGREVLPPPDRSVSTKFKFYIARWTRAHGVHHASENHESH